VTTEPLSVAFSGPFGDLAQEAKRFGFETWLRRVRIGHDELDFDSDDVAVGLHKTGLLQTLTGGTHFVLTIEKAERKRPYNGGGQRKLDPVLDFVWLQATVDQDKGIHEFADRPRVLIAVGDPGMANSRSADRKDVIVMCHDDPVLGRANVT